MSKRVVEEANRGGKFIYYQGWGGPGRKKSKGLPVPGGKPYESRRRIYALLPRRTPWVEGISQCNSKKETEQGGIGGPNSDREGGGCLNCNYEEDPM